MAKGHLTYWGELESDEDESEEEDNESGSDSGSEEGEAIGEVSASSAADKPIIQTLEVTGLLTPATGTG
ncbi:unnamed protein product [Protopolystoma xenopodis]|uniref:Uncharacterized protein n=1 Tax=Protopolystoma xenopodis TaxID=117903 RepID=A0A448WSB6_9PLAT|nr:unnamed protein product [Protopolystoma xenopodis]